MTTGIRPYPGAALTREQHLVLLVFSLCLTGLLAWRTGLIWPSPPPPPATQQKYFSEITGNIPRPGIRVFVSPPTVQEVWEAAGGQGALANPRQPVNSGARLTVDPEQNTALTRMSGQQLLTLGLAVDPNLAFPADLEALPGIGPVLAKRIVEFREVNGPFQNIENLLEVKGMGPKVLEKIKPYVVIIADSHESPQ